LFAPNLHRSHRGAPTPSGLKSAFFKDDDGRGT
jgi:hypothetical protein